MTALPINRREKWEDEPTPPQRHLLKGCPMRGRGLEIREYLANFGPSSAKQIGEFLKIDHYTVNVYLKKLRTYGAVKRITQGRRGPRGHGGKWALSCYKQQPVHLTTIYT